MTTPAIVGIVAVVLAVVILIAFLLRVAVVLKGFSARLTDVVSAVGSMAERTAPVGPAVEALERDLAGAQQLLASAQEPDPSNAGGAPATEPPADPDPEAEPDAASTPPSPPTPTPPSPPTPTPPASTGSDRLAPMRPQYLRRPRPN